MPAARPFSCLAFNASNLFQALANQHCAAAEVAKNPRAQYLARYLAKIDAQSIVVETDYVDQDYLEDFASYYVRCFCSYPRWCRRLHFFGTPLDDAKVIAAVRGEPDGAVEDLLKSSYLGFVVARPLPSAIIGRTVLKTYPDDNGRRRYTCLTLYESNLFGVDLSVRSLAYQEQDTVLAACATVALWSCFNRTRVLFGSRAPSPAEITRQANLVAHDARPIPSRGLNVQQICHAIHQVGLEPEVFRVSAGVPLPSLLCAYLRCGHPVLLGVNVEGEGPHAIALTGYAMGDAVSLPHEVGAGEKAAQMRGRRVTHFFAHDDQIGPFSRIAVRPSVKVSTPAGEVVYPVAFDGSWMDNKTGRFLTLYPLVVIIPVYHKVRVTFMDLQKWLGRLSTVLLAFQQPLDYEWDVFLTTSNDLKRDLRSPGVSGDLRQALSVRGHPRYIWRCVLRVSGTPRLELIGDATDMDRSFPAYATIWHDSAFKNSLRSLLTLPPLLGPLQETLTLRFWEFLKEQAEGVT